MQRFGTKLFSGFSQVTISRAQVINKIFLLRWSIQVYSLDIAGNYKKLNKICLNNKNADKKNLIVADIQIPKILSIMRKINSNSMKKIQNHTVPNHL